MKLALGLVLPLAFAVPTTLAASSAPVPDGVLPVQAGPEQLTMWPYITTNYLSADAGRSDPVNLVFLDSDPRAIRQELMKLDSNRPAWSFLPPGANGCVWMDAMGEEQAAYVEPDGWVGGAVQLACATPASPLGREYRFHLRLFRSGPHTLGGTHFEINVPGTAQHEVLSWDLARSFVTDEIARIAPAALVGTTDPLFAGGSFRSVAGLINGYVWQSNLAAGRLPFLLKLMLPPPQAGLPPVPIPTSARAVVLAPDFVYEPVSSDVTLTDSRSYSVAATPKPFCGGALIQITGGPLTLTLRVQTNPSGKYLRTYTVSGALKIKTLSTGIEQDAVISELHRGMLTDNYGEATQAVSQTLLPADGAVGQALTIAFGAGQNDYWLAQETCAIE